MSIHKSPGGLPATALREIALLKNLDHPNVARLLSVVGNGLNEDSSPERLYLIFEFQKYSLKEYLKEKSPLNLFRVRSLATQLFKGSQWR